MAPITHLKPHRFDFEQRLTDFGVLDPHHTEPETAELAGDIARVMQISPMTRVAAAAWRVGTRVVLAAVLIGAVAALTGCGGGGADDDEEDTGPAPVYTTVPCFIVQDPRVDPITECWQLQAPAPAASAASSN